MPKWILLCLFFSNTSGFAGEETDTEEMEADAEKTYNATYSEELSRLETQLFAKYERNRRPVKNQSVPIDVQLHFHVIHATVDEKVGTMNFNGHLYMTWRDEFLGWDPLKYNGVKQFNTKKWSIWTPQLRAHNSASGAASSWDISKIAHVLINSKGENAAQVEVYPSMSMKVTCDFDFTDFPDDIQECTVRVFSFDRLNLVNLRFYGNLPASLSLGWGDQASKNKIGNWQFLGSKNVIEYYDAGNYSTVMPPAERWQNAWAVLRTTFKVKRHAALFGAIFKLPSYLFIYVVAIVCLLPNIRQALLLSASMFGIQTLFLHDFVMKVPSTAGQLPSCLKYYQFAMQYNGLMMIYHFALLWGPPAVIPPFLATKELITKNYHENLKDRILGLASAFRSHLALFTLIIHHLSWLILVL
ncbi:unnamed protein product, partial [Mesorhabditis spiculigera]